MMIWVLAPVLILLAGHGQSGEYIQDLQHENAEIRESAAKICGLRGIKTAIPYLIERLRVDDEKNVITAAHIALKLLTGKTGFGPEYGFWNDWWEKEGSENYPTTNLTRQQIVEILDPRVQNLKLELEDDVKKANL